MFRIDEFRKRINTTTAMESRTLENKLNVLYVDRTKFSHTTFLYFCKRGESLYLGNPRCEKSLILRKKNRNSDEVLRR
jgi:hypothetical protein